MICLWKYTLVSKIHCNTRKQACSRPLRHRERSLWTPDLAICPPRWRLDPASGILSQRLLSYRSEQAAESLLRVWQEARTMDSVQRYLAVLRIILTSLTSQ